MRFAHFFVDRPIFASVTSIIFLILGFVAYESLPVSQYPEIVPPTVTVRASYPGANAETVAATIATPIEQEVNGVDNMLYMTSLSTNDGNMLLTVTFKVGTNLDIANVLVQNRLSVAQPRLPPDVRNLGVTVRKASPDLMLVVHLLSPNKTYDQNYLANYIYLNIRDELLRLDGVGDITVFGGNEYAERIWVDPNKLAAYGLSVTDVTTALQEQNVQVAAGQLNGPPAAKGEAFQLVVQSQARFKTPEQFAEVIIKAQDGRLVRVKDIARVEMGQKDYTTNSYLNDTPAVGIGAFQRPGTNALEAATSVKQVMEVVKKNFPPDVEYRIAYNPTEFIEESIQEVYKTLFEAVGLVVIVVLVFLQSWRTALIPVIAIPVSLIGTFAAMAAFGFSLNNLTLFGLVLAIGIVVDDAIVVVENVERNMAEGLSPGDAAHKTMDEVGGAVIAIALVLAAVFVPTAFIPGISGQFYKQFALTIAASTLISAFNSLTLSPALCKLLLVPHHARKEPKFFLTRFVNWLANGFNRAFDATSNFYGRTIRVLTGGFVGLGAMLLVYAAVIAGTLHLAQTTPTGFIPDQDQGYLIGVVQLPSGSSLDRTTEVMLRAAKQARTVHGIANAVIIAGFDGATFTNTTNAGVMFLTLTGAKERAGEGRSAAVLTGEVLKATSDIQEARVIVIPPPPVRGLGNGGGFKLQIESRQSSEIGPLMAAAGEVIAQANQSADVQRVFTTFDNATPQLFLDIDRTIARMLNVPLANVFSSVQADLGGTYVNDFNTLGRIYQVRLQGDAAFRSSIQDISQIKVRSSTGALVPMGTLASVRDVTGPQIVQRFNLYYSVPVQGVAKPGVSTGQALTAMEEIAKKALPEGYSYDWTEIAYQQKAASGTAGAVFALGVLLVFLVLAAQYESWALPMAILLVVPTGVLAALAGVQFRGQDNNILTQIGLIVLIGLAAKNAILIVEFAHDIEQREHRGPVEAAVEACRLRLRPILMTAFAFILGTLPLVIATGPGAEMRQALGTAVFFGMIGATFFGLFLTPVFYVVIRHFSLWLGRLRGKPSHGDHGGAAPAHG
ncbi:MULTISPECIES: efflux RND transporter permease subunit [Methylobacterium]|jgi:HAE1 family hydrophobic/amphiphilic exporter-1|uniref:Efflux pump membrane transporter n=1 Tax=Methylobacterium brachiatum TaxID=269660 RepID=A0AAJ1TQ91_9HYPH|nr:MULTISPECIES: multidrug efflux RND transporter permease subunit [Methylobacterium]AYO81157.1 multidrug efflux RND transporter permease subunit [Methylobacterium brachiatum]EIZ86196.1 hydrophobe/amphiphile efflux-1 (HAE1) family protein [Methylobacterium sp. GXF4]MCB4803821.1 multidrug efflux RND transporter permease subunit [Methylobacterium brachiatum]MDF2601463.1 transporter, hydrophobe/amphiphile efflux family [Methylobacterium brachiatum]MDH2310965.1 multidrug efflux RND transporter per